MFLKLGLITLVSWSALTFAKEVKITGSATTYPILVQPNAAAVEASTGIKLTITVNTTPKGLIDLMDGNADTSMISEPLAAALSAAKLTGKEIDATKIQVTPVTDVEYFFVVNKANPVTKISKDQLKGILTGKITNWKEVGGSDSQVVVLTNEATSGTCEMLKLDLMDGQEFGPNRKALAATSRIAENVSDFKGAIAALSKGLIKEDKMKTLDVGQKLTRPLGFVTRGAPSPDVLKVINAFKAKAK